MNPDAPWRTISLPAASRIATSPSRIAMNGIAAVADLEEDVAGRRRALLADRGERCELGGGEQWACGRRA